MDSSKCKTKKCKCIIQLRRITRATQHIWPEVTVKGFKKCCMSNAADGTDDDMLWNGSGIYKWPPPVPILSQSSPCSPFPLPEDITIPIYQINTDKCTDILLSHHFINAIHQSNKFQPLKGHLQGVYLIHSSSNVNKMSYQM